LVMSLRAAAPTWITVLTYHRVARRGDVSTLDEGVVDATPELLDAHLAFVKRWFRPIGIDDLRRHAAGRALPPNPLLITFDDGYRDTHDVALPILSRHGIRAAFFVATYYVERRLPYWWDRLAFVIKRSTRERLTLEYPERLDLERGAAALRALQRIVKDRRGL